MTPALVPLWAAAGLLVVAGAGKLRDPTALVAALRAVRMPAGPGLARALAAAEVGVGLAALTTGARPAVLLVTASYLGFTAYVLLALRGTARAASCGCFGSADTPPSVGHVVTTAGYALAAGVAAFAPPGSLAAIAAAGPGSALAAALLAGVTATATVLLLATGRTSGHRSAAGHASSDVRRSAGRVAAA